ncbi:MAG: D-amino-acid transaminase [Ignavibacteriaceae bacterium]|nr:D-amino-acid transaminase [Ignavibacteriaceae bacterium]
MIVYFNGQFQELNEVKISPFDRGFLYADGVYEVIRTYYGKLFKYADHLERFKASLDAIKINYAETDLLEQNIYKLFELNKYTNPNISFYIQITRGVSFPRKHPFPSADVKPTVFISASTIENDEHAINKGIKAILEEDTRWTRCNIKSVSLLPAVLANQHAVEEGAEEAIMIRDGLLMEGSHTNFWGIKNGEVWTAPLSNLILPGITRTVILEICSYIGIRVNEQAIDKNDINNFDEFFISGTTTEVKPVTQIGADVIGSGVPGEITCRIYDAYLKYVESRNWF